MRQNAAVGSGERRRAAADVAPKKAVPAVAWGPAEESDDEESSSATAAAAAPGPAPERARDPALGPPPRTTNTAFPTEILSRTTYTLAECQRYPLLVALGVPLGTEKKVDEEQRQAVLRELVTFREDRAAEEGGLGVGMDGSVLEYASTNNRARFRLFPMPVKTKWKKATSARKRKRGEMEVTDVEIVSEWEQHRRERARRHALGLPTDDLEVAPRPPEEEMEAMEARTKAIEANAEAIRQDRIDESFEQYFHDRHKSPGKRFLESFFVELGKCMEGDTPDFARDGLLRYLAKLHPGAYLRNAEPAREWEQHEADRLEKQRLEDEKQRKDEERRLNPPEGFRYYDGTDDFTWNVNYHALLQYREEHGDTKVQTLKSKDRDGNELARWVAHQRYTCRTLKEKEKTGQVGAPYLVRRFELLEEVGFVWNTRPYDPRPEKALVAKLFYPSLSVRQALLLGGYDEEGMDEAVDAKYAWRTQFVVLKDKLNKYVKKYRDGQGFKSKKDVEKKMEVLRTKPLDGPAEVFGENAFYLHGFLEAAGETEEYEE